MMNFDLRLLLLIPLIPSVAFLFWALGQLQMELNKLNRKNKRQSSFEGHMAPHTPDAIENQKVRGFRTGGLGGQTHLSVGS